MYQTIDWIWCRGLNIFALLGLTSKMSFFPNWAFGTCPRKGLSRGASIGYRLLWQPDSIPERISGCRVQNKIRMNWKTLGWNDPRRVRASILKCTLRDGGYKPNPNLPGFQYIQCLSCLVGVGKARQTCSIMSWSLWVLASNSKENHERMILFHSFNACFSYHCSSSSKGFHLHFQWNKVESNSYKYLVERIVLKAMIFRGKNKIFERQRGGELLFFAFKSLVFKYQEPEGLGG